MDYDAFVNQVNLDFAENCEQVDQSVLDTILMAPSDPPATQRYGRMLLKLGSGELGSVNSPQTKKNIRRFLNELGFKIPDTMSIRIEARDVDEFIILLPSKPVMDAAVCVAKDIDAQKPNPRGYVIPQPYRDKTNGTWTKTELDFLQFIIGDYTMRYCR